MTAQADTMPDTGRKERVLDSLKGIVHSLTGIRVEGLDIHTSFFDVGVDSLMLIQATQSIQDEFAVKLSVVQMLEELNTLDAVATFIEQALPPGFGADAQPAAAPEPAPAAAAPPVAAPMPPPAAVPSAAPPQAPAPAPTAATQTAPAQFETRPAAPAAPAPVVAVPAAPAAQVAPPPAAAEPARVYAEQPGASASLLEQLMAQQLQLMGQQLELLRGAPAAAAPSPVAAPLAPAQAQTAPPPAQPSPAAQQPPQQSAVAPPSPAASPAPAAAPVAKPPAAGPRQIEPELFIPYQPIEKGPTGGLTARQQQHLDDFIKKYNERTRGSKRLTQEHRPYIADSRVSAGFRLLWKEMVYQLYGARSAGSKMWDVDGNEYVDVTMGFGLHLFGHSPDFVTAALERQLKQGTHLGPQIELTGEVAKLIRELTGVERVNFCNSGTEAVLGALRIARTITRRTKIALFAGAYHGWADPTMVRVFERGGERVNAPMAPGVPPLAVEETLVLDWNDPHALDTLRAHAHELACVLVEPVQSRRPDIQPREFLHELRRITKETGVVLIMDEMVTGFRILPGGAQKWFGVEADLVIYGKVLGAGLPLGIVGGKAEYMDAFDGGAWEYGDGSYPRAEKTLFAGAYFKHPLTMAVAHAILTRLRDEGEELLTRLNERTTRLVETLDRCFAEQLLPARIVNYGSLFRILFSREYKYADLFYYHLVHNGVFIWEGRNCFLSTAHTDADVEFFIEAVKKSVREMREGGFLPELPPGAPAGGDRPADSASADGGASSSSLSSPAERPASVTDRAESAPTRAAAPQAAAGLTFSLYFFGNYPTPYQAGKYELLFKSVKFADRHGFEAVWLPERHFNSYGGFSPNPSILAAALANETERIKLRAGSVVLPLHDPIRVAEDWAVIDNLSNGRVAISFASGWHPNDFVFAPDIYEQRRDVMDEGIEIVRHLWRGGQIERRSGRGDVIKVGLSAMPAQAELPIWVTGGTHGTGAKAGRLGAGFLTNLQDQTIDELAAKTETYRKALAEHGHDPAAARATCLLHTYVAEDLEKSLRDSRGPFREYMRSAMGLRSTRGGKAPQVDLSKASEADLEYFLNSGFERYKQVGSLIGTPDSCSATVDRLVAAGVTEIGCLIDFGVPVDEVMESLHHLNTLRERYLPRGDARDGQPDAARETLTLASGEQSPAEGEGYSVPLTEVQKQFWFLTQLGDHVSRQYNESITMRLAGPLNVEAMRAAIKGMVARHDALRSTFTPDGKSQHIHPAVDLDVPLVDFTHLDAAERESRATAWAKELGRQPFDLARGPVVRAAFARLADDLHLMLFSTHHLVADGQAWGVMMNEMRELYIAGCTGRPAPLPEPVKLGEQATRRPTMTPQEEAAAEAFWVSQFADGFPASELPTDRPRPAVPSYERAQVYSVIEAEIADGLKALSKRQRSTPFITILAGYSLLLHQLTGRDDLVVGLNVADPLSVRRKDAVGYRLNPQVLRSKLAPGTTFAEHLAATKSRVYAAYEHQSFSVAKVFQALKLKRDPRGAPLVAAGLNLERADPPASLHGLEVEFSLEATTAPSLDLYLDIAEVGDELRVKCNYNTDVFDERTAANWMRHFRDLLAAVVADPARPVSELPRFAATDGGQEQAAAEASGGAGPETEAGGPPAELTKFQQLLWAGQRLNPDEVIYVNLGTLFISKRIDPVHMRAAFQAVVDRSDALRTVIEEHDGVPRQRVLTSQPYEMEFLDFSGDADPRASFEAWAAARRRAPLDIGRRVFDSALAKLADEEFAWFLNVHHVVADAWSFFLVYQYGLDYYESSLAGTLAERPALPPFADYLAYEAALPQSRKYQEAEAYWKQKLAEPVEPLHFYGRPPVKRTTRVERVSRPLGPERTRRLKAAAAHPDLFIASEDATLSLVFAALAAGFVSRATGSRRLSLGVPFHNRPTPASRQTIGLFMQILPLHVSVEDGDTFASLVGKLRAELFTALRHHQYGVGNPIHGRTYDVECNFINSKVAVPDGTPVRVEWPHPGHAHESLAVQVHDISGSGELTVTFDFHEDIFGPEQREQAVGQYFRLLDAFAEDHTRPLRSVALLSEDEARRVLFGFNQTAAAFPLDQTFAQLFEAQAERTPARTAAADDGQTLSYAELNARANRLARELRELGVGAGVVVPLLAPRGVDLLTAILAVFKAGGAYLPLDPLYPSRRILQLVEQSRAALLLTAGDLPADLAAPLAESAGRGDLRVRPLAELLARGGDDANLPAHAGPDDLAYVIYTSGSTGVPKGAMLEQRGMVNHLFAKVADLKLTESDTVVQNASQSFDISVWQFLAALVVGGRVRVVGDEAARDARQLLALLEAESVTVFETVPSMLGAMLSQHEADPGARPALSALRWMIVTGEALPPELCRRWLAAYPRVPVLNAYGPTECSDDVTHHVVARPPAAAATSVPIGRPVANTQLYVLDESFAPLPAGMPGELYVGGAGVGRGYLGDAARTAAAFVPDPFAQRPGARLYRTGDLARFMPDGALEFLGRVDHQVKIRGHRIELGEIESVLRQQPGVAEAVVTARAEAEGGRRLVAYFVAREGEAVSVNELRAALKERLPEYMTPSAFVRLDALPLSANGKVDLKALPAPDPARPELEAGFVAPRGAAEEALAEIFRQVLNVERVGAHDNYFELGGDSILSIQIASRAAQAGLRLTPVMLFQHQTVATLAAAASAGAGEVRAEQGAVTGEVPLTPVQHWFFERELPNPHHYNQTLLLETRRPLDPAVLRRAVRHVLEQHDMLGARFEQSGGALWRQHLPGAASDEAVFSRHDLSALPEAERRGALEAEAARLQTGLHLSAGPLVRFALFDFGPGAAGRLLLAAHHLVVDGVSWRVIVEDLQTAYEQLSRGEAVRLPPKSTSFKEWAERLAAHAQSDELAAELDYWLAPPRGEARPLPVDLAGGENLISSATAVSVTLTADETEALLRHAPAALDAQVGDLLLTALARSLSQWTGGRAVRVNLENHGREEIFPEVDLTRTVGWFTTMSPVLLDLGEAATPAEELAAVRDQLRRVPRRGIGYGLLRYLREDAGLRERMRAAGAAEISFNYLGQIDQALPESGLFKLAAESAGQATSREGRRTGLFDVNALVVGGRLRCDWSFSQNLHERETVERLARGFAEALRSLVGRPSDEAGRDGDDDAGDPAPAGLEDFNWGQAEADEVAAALDGLEP